MANKEQLSILKQGVEVWNEWRDKNPDIEINLRGAGLSQTDLRGSNLLHADLLDVNLSHADLREADLRHTNLAIAKLREADFRGAYLHGARFSRGELEGAMFHSVSLHDVELSDVDLSEVVGLDEVKHSGPSTIGTNTVAKSKGKISEVFLRGCGLSDWEIEQAKLYNPDLSNDEINAVLYKVYDLRATQALQISPLFISYSHGDSEFVNRIGEHLTEKGIRYWRDIQDLKAGRVEKQLDNAIRQNPTVLLILSSNSIKSDWVQHEVRTARELEKEMGQDVLCPVALDDSWKSSPWPKRVMEQIMEYNILDFSAWKDDSKFDGMFRKLIDGLGLFYKG